MKYHVSQIVYLIDVTFLSQFDKDIKKYLKKNMKFVSKEFNDFIVVLQAEPKSEHGKFKDKIQISKKEESIFLGVKLDNEYFEHGDYIEQLHYIISRIEEVKKENILRLVKNGLVSG